MAEHGGRHRLVAAEQPAALRRHRRREDVRRPQASSIALGSDWSPSGSKNLLSELKVARAWSDRQGGVFTPRELVAMATINPARMLKWDAALGSIEPDKRADFVVLKGKTR